MVNTRFHVWTYSDKRKRSLTMLTRKMLSRHDPVLIPAVWNSRPAAHQWAKAHHGKGNYLVLDCTCESGTGMGDHG